jgi:hypothetical protein
MQHAGLLEIVKKSLASIVANIRDRIVPNH